MTLKVDVILPENSQYLVLHHFTEKLFEAFQRKGYQARLLTLEKYKKNLFTNRPDFTIGFNGAPFDEISKEFFCDQTRVPHISCLVDPPYRFMRLLTSPYIIIACDDNYWVEAFKEEGYSNLYFLPHAIEPELAPDFTAEPIYDAVFLGTYIDPETCVKQWRDRHPEQICQAMEEALERPFSKERIYFPRAIIEALNSKMKKETIPQFNLALVLQDLEMYIKGRERIELIRSIKNTRVDVFGGSLTSTGWKEQFASQPNVVVHSEVTYDKAINIIRQSKIVLSTNMKSSQGGHERIFSALALGSAVLTSSNSYLEEHFKDSKSILLYSPYDLSILDDKVFLFLQDDITRKESIQNGRELVMSKHTWDERLSEFMPKVLPVIQALNA